MTPTQPNPSTNAETLARLNAERKHRHITLEMVAREAAKTAKTGTCSIPTASKALSGDEPNANVLGAVRRLLARQPRRRKTTAA